VGRWSKVERVARRELRQVRKAEGRGVNEGQVRQSRYDHGADSGPPDVGGGVGGAL
jgi:hypothetical protein